MGNKYLIDTNSVIDYLDNKLPSEAKKIIDTIEFRISVITRIELLSWSGASKEQTIILNDFINACDVYSLEEPIILKTIEIRKTKKQNFLMQLLPLLRP